MIRPFQPGDIEPLLALWLQSTIRAHPFISPDYWHESLPLVRDEFLPQSRSWVAEHEGVLTGFISVMMDQFIGAVFVAPGYWRQGIGSSLMALVKRHYPVLSLEVYRLNRSARAFYYQQGFRECGSMFNAETGHNILTLYWRAD